MTDGTWANTDETRAQAVSVRTAKASARKPPAQIQTTEYFINLISLIFSEVQGVRIRKYRWRSAGAMRFVKEKWPPESNWLVTMLTQLLNGRATLVAVSTSS